MKKYNFHVYGMHCPSCPILIESELSDLKEVENTHASLKNNSVEITADFGDKTQEHIINDLNEVMKKHGYSFTNEKQIHSVKWSEFYTALPIAILFIVLFILLQKSGIINLTTSNTMTLGTAFIIGIVASVSSCMAVVGGLVLSMSANFAKSGDKFRPQILFHVGRLISFFILGGVIGYIGSSFSLGSIGTFIIGVIVALILFVLGINLLDIFPSLKKFQIALPGVMSKKVNNLQKINNTFTPLLLGVATFFLPCGFTQSMQFYALSTGSFATGAMTMFVFALGTLPVLALLSFGSNGIQNKSYKGIFFKVAGLIVVFFGIFNLINSLVAIGFISPIFNL